MIEQPSASAIFEGYTLGQAYDEMFEGPGCHRPHYAGIHERLCGLPIEHLAGAPARRRRRLSHAGHHLHGLRPGRRRGAHLSVRPAAAAGDGGGMGDDRAGPRPAHHRAQPLSPRRLPRGPDLRGRRRAADARASMPSFPARDGRRPGAARLLSDRRGHRSRSRPGRPVPGARGQPARAERRLVHAGEPPDRQAGVPAAVRALQRPPDRSLPPNAARAPARDRTRGLLRSQHRPVDARASSTRPTTSTRSSRTRWGSIWSRGATCSSTTTPSMRARPAASNAWTSSTGAWTTTTWIR